MESSNGYPKTVEGLAWRLDHQGCLFCDGQHTDIRNEVKQLRDNLAKLEGSLSKAVWLVVGAAIVSAFGLVNTVITVMAAKP